MCAVSRSSSSSCVGLAVNLLLSFVAGVGRGGRMPSGGRPVNGSIIAPRIAWNDCLWLSLGLLLLEKVKQGATETVQPYEEAWTQGQAKEQGQNC